VELKFIQMVGLPGSGKTEKAKELAKVHNAILLSSDAIREELFGDASDQTDNTKVFEEMYKRTITALGQGKSVIYDATNINYKRRKVLLEQLRSKFEFKAIAVVMATPIRECINRQKQRSRVVDKEVIWKMVRAFYTPYWYEGWNDIQLCYPDEYCAGNNIEGLINKTSLLYDFDQKNPHHSLSLGEHMYDCYKIMCGSTFVDSLKEAALLHDIGKVYTQSFKDGVAHYYEHHHVSAYMSLFEQGGVSNTLEVLSRAAYIQWHMAPYFWVLEKTKKRYKKLLGEQFYDDIMMLHECDREAH